ncbi:MAG: hypothetical protein AB7O26_01505 [Planctomycetaceae bacterium]
MSNEETSTFDERLTGIWEIVPPDGEIADEPFIAIVGRKRDTKNTLEFVTVELQKGLGVRTKRMAAYARPGNNSYLSITALPETDSSEKSEFVILKYEMPDDKTVKLYFPKTDVLRNAVEAGKLKGKIEQPKGLFEPGGGVTLSDSPDVIVRFLDENAETCFTDSMTFRKTKNAPKAKQQVSSKE